MQYGVQKMTWERSWWDDAHSMDRLDDWLGLDISFNVGWVMEC